MVLHPKLIVIPSFDLIEKILDNNYIQYVLQLRPRAASGVTCHGGMVSCLLAYHRARWPGG